MILYDKYKNDYLLLQNGGELACVNPNKCPTCIACKSHYINFQYNSKKCEEYCNLNNVDLQAYIIKSTKDIIAVYKPPFMYVSVGLDKKKINKNKYLQYIKIISKSFTLKQLLLFYKKITEYNDIVNIKQKIYKLLLRIKKYNTANIFIEQQLLNNAIILIKNDMIPNTDIIKHIYEIYNHINLFIKKSELYIYYNFIIDNYFENYELKNMTKIIYPEGMFSPFRLSLSNMYSIQHYIMNNLDMGFMSLYKYKYGICNRLDFKTSGIIICAKTVQKYTEIRKKINDHSTFKIYITLLNGVVQEKDDIIYTKYNLDKKTSAFPHIGKIKHETNISSDYTPHKSIFKIIKVYDDYTLCLVRILTGHHHQIRASIQIYGYPIVSDDIYCIIHKNTEKNLLQLINNNLAICPRLFLHAMLYKFDDFEVFSELPPDLCSVLLALGETYETINNLKNQNYLAEYIKILLNFDFN